MALALIGLAVGTLLLIPFSRLASSKVFSSFAQADELAERHAAEAGVEDAIWRLTNGALASQLSSPADSEAYILNTPINDIEVSVSVTRDYTIIASDDLESGSWSGGTGWSTAWQVEGSSTVTSGAYPHDGSFHVQMSDDLGLVKRAVNLSGLHGVRLQFWDKARSFSATEQVRCMVSPDGEQWTTVQTWSNGDDDNIYRFYDIDLSPYAMTAEFWIAFDTDLPDTESYFYIDAIKLVRRFPNSTLGTPSDTFESGNWRGGAGWTSDWAPSGRAWVTWLPWTHEGRYHMALMGPSGYAERSADLSNRSYAKLQVWIWPIAFEEGDHADCLVSNDGVNWISLVSWTVDDNSWYYHYIDVDVPQEYLTSTFRIAFKANMSSWMDFFFVDDLHIVGGPIAYEIVSTAGKTTARASVSIVDDKVTVHSWRTVRSTS